MSENPRRVRVSQAIRDCLSEIIPREVSDPRVSRAGIVCVNKVELNQDMAVAHVYVSFLGGKGEVIEGKATDALGGAAAYLRGPVGRALTLARAPELRFHYDKSGEFRYKLSEIVAEDEARAKAAGRGEDDGE